MLHRKYSVKIDQLGGGDLDLALLKPSLTPLWLRTITATGSPADPTTSTLSWLRACPSAALGGGEAARQPRLRVRAGGDAGAGTPCCRAASPCAPAARGLMLGAASAPIHVSAGARTGATAPHAALVAILGSIERRARTPTGATGAILDGMGVAVVGVGRGKGAGVAAGVSSAPASSLSFASLCTGKRVRCVWS